MMIPDLQNTELAAVCDNDSRLKRLLDASSQDSPEAAALLEGYLTERFPKAKGLLTPQAFNLLCDIGQIAPHNLRLGLKYKHGIYELWLIYQSRDYIQLEKAAALIAAYEGQNKTTVNCIWVSEEKLRGTAPQKFIFTL